MDRNHAASCDGQTGASRGLVFFKREEKARENEQQPEQREIVRRLQDAFDGLPSFVSLIPHHKGSR